MNTEQALRELGIDPTLSPQHKADLDRDGFFVVENVLSPEECIAMAAEFDRLAAEESDGGVVMDAEVGATRLSDIFNKTTVFDRTLELEPVLSAAHYLLGEIKLHGANIRDPHAGGGNQPLHSDVPKNHETDWRVVNALILLDELTLDNGPTRIVPGSHVYPHVNAPKVNLDEGEQPRGDYGDTSKFPYDPLAVYPGEIHLVGPAGSVAVTNASVWHGGTSNKSGNHRRMLHLSYTRRDLMQQFDQQKYLTEALYERLSPAERYLLDVTKPEEE